MVPGKKKGPEIWLFFNQFDHVGMWSKITAGKVGNMTAGKVGAAGF